MMDMGNVGEMVMIKASTSREYLPLFEALASEVRLEIIRLLSLRPMNVKEIATALALSSAIVTMHVRKLEAGGLIQTQMIRKDKGTHKICTLNTNRIEIELPTVQEEVRTVYEHTIPVGHFSDCEVHPTCGLASRDRLIGQYDDPRYFMEPERMHARILWFGKGYVEYRLPNYLMSDQVPEEIEITMELGSEAPGVNEHWPSDIQFYLNGVHLGQWTSPGDYGVTRGRYTPSWWSEEVNQYGLLKVLRIQAKATYMDGQLISNLGLGDIPIERNQWTLRLAVEEPSAHVGGLTIYGEGFGNYNQDISFKVYYQQAGKGAVPSHDD
jgi:predicted transcriptional regulator